VLADSDARGGLLDEVDLQRGLDLGQAFCRAPGEEERADGGRSGNDDGKGGKGSLHKPTGRESGKSQM